MRHRLQSRVTVSGGLKPARPNLSEDYESSTQHLAILDLDSGAVEAELSAELPQGRGALIGDPGAPTETHPSAAREVGGAPDQALGFRS